MSAFRRLLQKLEVAPDERPLSVLRNPDLEPIPHAKRQWAFWSFFAYYGLPNVSAATFSIGSALLSLGLDIKQSIGTIVVCNIVITLYTILNSNPGFKYHIGYTLEQRMLFGIYGSVIGIIIRVGLSVVLYGYLSWLGALCLNLIFSSWSKSYMNMRNTFPESVPMTTRDCISFLIFQLIQMPFSFIRPRKINVAGIVFCFMAIFSVIGILAYTVSANGGPGPLYYTSQELSSSQRAWTWLLAMTVWYSGISPVIANQSDYSRYGSHKLKMHAGVAIGVCLTGTLAPVAGMFSASATQQLYGEALWLPTDMALKWLEDNYSAKARCAVFFIGFSFTGTQLVVNLTQNGYACGMDLAGIFPKYINITRGTLFVQLISWVVQPWTFFNTSSAFIDSMTSFGIFTTPIMAINVVDYYIVRKTRISIADLFTLDPNGAFWFYHGFNLRAIFALLVGIALGLPGLIFSVNTKLKPNAGMNNFYSGYTFFTVIVSGLTYYILTLIFPIKQRVGVTDDKDYFNAFSLTECENLGMEPYTEKINCEYIDMERGRNRTLSGSAQPRLSLHSTPSAPQVIQLEASSKND
ncbi:LANO_0F06084g1_1 [Lachancea nothofagi CBS 11611]|uniref:LANO_0F06084g1_1 n=1 Tax=Lachancea nothofagi CBS 11611 TaxID=1266666 RepID=A0A1G4K8B3_9SACH|nr:LANO_0F06084g1_1 [Lachancea nothofagi CBS 11611]